MLIYAFCCFLMSSQISNLFHQFLYSLNLPARVQVGSWYALPKLGFMQQTYFIDGLVSGFLNPKYLKILAVRAYVPIVSELLVW